MNQYHLHFLDNSNYQDSVIAKKPLLSKTGVCWKIIAIENLMEEANAVVTGNGHFEQQQKSKQSNLWEFYHYEVPDAGKETMKFQLKNLLQNGSLALIRRWKKTNLNFCRRVCFQIYHFELQFFETLEIVTILIKTNQGFFRLKTSLQVSIQWLWPWLGKSSMWFRGNERPNLGIFILRSTFRASGKSWLRFLGHNQHFGIW